VLELNSAVLADGGLLDRIHFALEPGEFGSSLLVTADKEQRGPEDDDAYGCRDRVDTLEAAETAFHSAWEMRG